MSMTSNNGASLWPRHAHEVRETAGTTVVTGFAVKQVFDINNVQVCIGSTYTSALCEPVGR